MHSSQPPSADYYTIPNYSLYIESPTKTDDFPTHKLSKVRMNSQQEVSSAKLFINHSRLVIKNLKKLEPLSHLIDDEKIAQIIATEPSQHFTTLSHLEKKKANIKEENFEIKRNKLRRKPVSNKHLANVYGNEKGFRIKTVDHPDERERKIRKKIMKQFTNLRKGL